MNKIIYAAPAAIAAVGLSFSAAACGSSSAPQTNHQSAAPRPSASAPAPPSSGGGGTGQGSGQPVQQPQPPQPQQPGTAVLTCQNPVNGGASCSYVSAPTQITLAGDGTLYITVSWASSNYGGQTATATGEVYGNDCNPTCAGGTFNDEGPGTVTLSDPVDVGGTWYYNNMSVTLPSTDVATGQPINNYGPYTNLAP